MNIDYFRSITIKKSIFFCHFILKLDDKTSTMYMWISIIFPKNVWKHCSSNYQIVNVYYEKEWSRPRSLRKTFQTGKYQWLNYHTVFQITVVFPLDSFWSILVASRVRNSDRSWFEDWMPSYMIQRKCYIHTFYHLMAPLHIYCSSSLVVRDQVNPTNFLLS